MLTHLKKHRFVLPNLTHRGPACGRTVPGSLLLRSKTSGITERTTGLSALLLSLALLGCQPDPKNVTHTPLASPTRQASVPGISVEPDNPIERKAFYFPNDKDYGPKPEGVESLTLETPDGLKLKAWYLKPEGDSSVMLYFHGNGGNLTTLGNQFEAFRSAGFGALAVDYRGFGESQGDPSEQGLYVDGLAAYDKLVEECTPQNIAIYGRSLGGGVATYVAEHREARALILESTFTSTKDMARLSHGEKGAQLVDAFDNLSRMKKLKLPTLLIHGTKDETIPSSMSETLHQAAADSELWLIEGANHSTVRKTAGADFYGQRLASFLAKAKRD